MDNLVLIAVDTLRSDHLSCYGYRFRTSRHLDDFSRSAVVFSNAFSCTNATDPSFTSLFTGMEPHRHGITNHGKKISPGELDCFSSSKPPWLTSLLKEHGYTTVGIDWLGRWHRKDFDFYPFGVAPFQESVRQKNDSFRNCRAMTDEALASMENCRDKPFFLFVHYWDVHRPYNYPSRLTLRRFPHEVRYISEYDAAVFTVDRQIARIIKSLKKKKLLEETIVVLTADHGESLGEHGIHDHHGLYDCSVRIPLIIRAPGTVPQRIDSFVQTTDILPTVLELLGIPLAEGESDGLSLAPFLSGSGKPLQRRRVYLQESFWEKKFAVRTGDRKLIVARNEGDATCSACHRIHGDGLLELYDLANDPGESQNISGERPALVDSLREEIIDHFGAFYTDEVAGNDGVTRGGHTEEERLIEERLRELGYH